MDDRTLLELAAKAAGWKRIRVEENGVYKVHGWHEGYEADWEYWNPLTDDGDALRLAASLEIDIEFHINVEAIAWGRRANGEQRHVSQEPGLSMPATRRAIVRAAAAIGGETK